MLQGMIPLRDHPAAESRRRTHGSPRLSAVNAMSPSRILPSLTPLRGIAAFWVVLYHYNIWAPNLGLDNQSPVIAEGYLAVDLFFMISGFVMSHVYQRAFRSDLSGSYFRFIGARIARLYPLHIFILLLFFATALSAHTAVYFYTGEFKPIPLTGARSITALFANLFMLQGLKASQLSWNYPSWSISVEFMAYFLFPFALAALWRTRPMVKIAVALALIVALGCLALMTGDSFDQWDGARTLLRCLPEFLLGILLYELFCSGRGRRLLGSDLAALGLLLIIGVLLHTGVSDFASVLMFALLLLAAVANQGWFGRVLNTAPLIWLGDVSYSLYLAHGFVQFTATRLLAAAGIHDLDDVSQGASFAVVAVMLVASFALATATHATIERTGRERLKRYFGLTKTKGRVAPVTVSRNVSRPWRPS